MNLPPIIGTSNVTLQDVRIAPAGPPHTYLGMAQLLLNAVDPLVAAGGSCAVPLAFVSAQVAECALKSALSKDGDDRRLRDKALRHNLKALWHLAHAEGLPVSATPPEWIDRLSQLHETPYYIRYSTGVHGLVTPAPAQVQVGLRDLVDVVGQYVRS